MEGIRTGEHPQVLLVGNGINMAFHDPSWENLVKDELAFSKSDLTYEEIQSIPATMQIVLATKDHVDDRLKLMAGALEKQEITEERKAFLTDILKLPMDAVLTTNYSFELERAAGFNKSIASYRRKLVRTKQETPSKDSFRLYQYYPLNHASLWHVHGDIAKPNSIIMGHYFYGKLLRDIQNYVASFMHDYHDAVSRGIAYKPKSWVDYFLLGDVYIIGLGLYLCEADLWWLLCCKKRNFPETKIHYYGELKKTDERRLLLEVYCGKIVDEIRLERDQSGNTDCTKFQTFYRQGFCSIDLESKKNRNR